MHVSYLRRPLTTGRPVSEMISEDELYTRIRSRSDIKGYTEYIRSSPDISTKGPIYDERKRRECHAVVFPLALPQGGRMSPMPSDDRRYTGLIHLDVDDQIVDGQRETLPDIPNAWNELAALPFARWLGHSLSGALWVAIATDNASISRHHGAWEYAVSLLPEWIRPFVGSASSAANGLRFIAHCGCAIFRPDADLLQVPASITATSHNQAAASRKISKPGKFPLSKPISVADNSLEWLGVSATLDKLSLHGRRIGDTVRMDCPAHSGSASSHHLSISAASDRLLCKCFSDKCSADYNTLATAIERVIQCRLSPIPN